MKRSDKEDIIVELHEKFQRTRHAILTDFSGLDVPAINRLRHDLKRISVDYRVVKNTLVRKACKDTQMEILTDYFSGPTAVAFSEGDPIPALKLMIEFMKDQPELEFKVGLVEGQVNEAEKLKAISKLPNRQELITRLLVLFNIPLLGLLQVLKGAHIQLVRTLAAILEGKEKVEKTS